MECYIITGVSRGIGKALAMELAAPGRVVYAASRSAVPALEEHYRQKGLVINHRCVDLSDERGARNFGREVFLMVKESRPDAVFLINNAAMLDPVSPCGREEAWAYTAHIGLNLIAAMALTSEFLHAFRDMEAEKGVMNLSSGAGRTPYAGWSAYCAGKAGLDMFTRCVALEQETEPYPTRVIAIGPGIVDTGMQAQLRATAEQDFPMREKFIRLRESGRLSRPEDTARMLLRALKEVPSGTVSDVRELYGV